MKKCLLIHKSSESRTREWQVAADLAAIDLTVVHFSDIRYHFSQSKAEVWVNDVALQSFEVIYFRTKSGFEEDVTLISLFAKQNGIKVVDEILLSNAFIDRKTWQYAMLSQAKLPVIESWIGYGASLVEMLPRTFPMILKESDLDQGEGVFMIKSQQELDALVKKKKKLLIAQPFIKNNSDLRIFVCFCEVLGGIERLNSNPNEFRNNIAQGGVSLPHLVTDELKKLAISAAKSLKYDIAGVDLIFDSETKNWKIMEVNCGPQYKSLQMALRKNIPLEVLSRLARQ